MADIRPDRLMTCQSERKSVVSRRPSVYNLTQCIYGFHVTLEVNGDDIRNSINQLVL
jgi:hypothetical protein